MTLAEFIQELANRVELNIDDYELKSIVTNPALSQIQAPNELHSLVQTKLMTEDDAKINPSLNAHFKKHYIGTALKTVDGKINELLDRNEFDQDWKSNILNESNTYNKIELISEALRNLKQNTPKSEKNDSNYLQKIEELQSALEFEKESRQWYLDEVNNNWKSQLLEKEMNNIFGQYDYSVDVDKDIAIETARKLFEKKLNEAGGKYVYGENGINLVQSDAPELPFTLNNKKVELKSFVDNVLAEKKLLKVNSQQQVSDAKPINDVAALRSQQTAAPAAISQTKKAIADFIAGT